MSDQREPTEAEKALAELPSRQDIGPFKGPNNLLHTHEGDDVLSKYTGKARSIIEKCAETGEPIFVFRARDIFSVRVIADYLREVEQYGPSDHEFQQEIAQGLQTFKDWQHAHPGQVRYPD